MKRKRWDTHRIPILFALITCAGAALLSSAAAGAFSAHDKAFYASQRDVSFVRPGLKVQIVSASIAPDGTIQARVRFTDPQGLPLDREGITTPGAISAGNPGMVAAYFPTGQSQAVSYTTRTQTSPITKETAIQAGADAGGTWAKVGEGEYTYTFRTKAPANFDKNAVHAIGVYANRILNEFEMGTQLDDDVYYFTPSDGKQVSNPRDEIRTGTCQKCHGPNMAFHGETGRSSLQMCDLCHTPQTTDPDTGNTVDLKVMIHKIHMGEHLPSVKSGGKYQIIGFSQTVFDFSTVAFPAPMMKCEVCHEQNRGAAQAEAHLNNPNRAACGSCHDDVNFATGEGHVNLPVLSDTECKRCHIPRGEIDFDASISGAHTAPQESNLLTGLQWEILNVQDAVAGKKPTITFSAKDKNGNGLPLSALARVAVTMAGPTTDYVSFGRGYVQEDAAKATGSNGTYSYTFNQAIPADAKGTYGFGVEGRRVEVVMEGTKKQRSIQYGAKNPITFVSVDGSPIAARREPTPTQNCLQCHYRLALHGENRVNNVQYCVFCHNPAESDAVRRPASAGPPQTIDLKFLAHRVHGGEELHNYAGVDYVVYGYGGNPISFSEVRYPGGLNQCFLCHSRGSENPGPQTASMSAVKTAQYPINPMPPITTACYGCHATNAMLSHASANTTALGESCTVCHGPGAEFAPTKMHASEIVVNKEQATK